MAKHRSSLRLHQLSLGGPSGSTDPARAAGAPFRGAGTGPSTRAIARPDRSRAPASPRGSSGPRRLPDRPVVNRRCCSLAERGFDLLLVARDAERLTALGAELSAQYNITADPWPADLSRDDGMRTLGEFLARNERVMLLVNNAGFGTKGKLATRPLGEQATMLELHVMAPMLLTRAVLPGMIARREGRIVNVASVASFTASPGNVNYCATKAYLRVFSEGLAMELAGTGVQVQALCPGFTHTEFHERMQIDKSKGIPNWMWLTADRVVRESLAAAFGDGPVVVIPGKRYRALVLALRYMPHWIRGMVQERYGRARI